MIRLRRQRRDRFHNGRTVYQLFSGYDLIEIGKRVSSLLTSPRIQAINFALVFF